MKLVFGLGKSGLAVIAFLARRGVEGRFFDDNPRPADAREARRLGFPADPNPQPGVYHEVIAAPGVPLDHPLLARLGAPVIGEAELAWRENQLEILAVTGTAGKTSTTAYTAWILRQLGVNATPGGNIGPPLVTVAERTRVVVAELSSFQLERIRGFHPRVAVILNLGEDHLDRHKNRAAYHRAKLRLLANLTPADAIVYNAADPAVLSAAEASPAQKYPFWPEPDADRTNRRAAALAARAFLAIHGLAANPKAIAEAARQAPPVPGRFEVVGSFGNVVFIDDSIATRALAVEAALRRAPPPIAWILGGRDKGASPERLRPLVAERVAVILAIGEDGPRLAQAFSDLVPVVPIRERGREALSRAVAEALSRIDHGSVLLAPMAASFDMFANYRERSQAFREAVKEATWTPFSS